MKSNSPEQGFAFEKVVKSIFSVLAAKERKPIQFDFKTKGQNNSRFESDIFLEEGLRALDIRSGTYVEIKNTPQRPALFDWCKRMKYYVPNSPLMLILNIEEGQAKELEYSLKNQLNLWNLTIVGNHLVYEYSQLVKAEYFFYLQSQGSVSSLEGENGVGSIGQNAPETSFLTESDLLAYQDEVEKKIRNCVNHEPVALLLGNGVSMSVGSRSWDCLSHELNYLLGDYLSYPSIDRKILGTSSYSDTLLSHYSCIKNAKGNRYYTTIYRCLYESAKIPAASGTLMDGAAQFVLHHFPTILTFNFDSLFEDELKQAYKISPITYWENKKEIHIKGGFSISHVHGYYPQNMPTLDDAHKNSLVLDEEEYYKFYCENGDVRRANLEKTLNTQTCFLVGLSISDSFLRNCLRQSGKKTHYAIMFNENLPSFPDLTTLSAIFYNMNIEVLWKKSFSEIGNFLASL
jgi:hypothetical protein